MNEQERKEFVYNEVEAIYEEFKNNVDQLVLLRHFFKDLVDASKGNEEKYKANDIFNKIKKPYN